MTFGQYSDVAELTLNFQLHFWFRPFSASYIISFHRYPLMWMQLYNVTDTALLYQSGSYHIYASLWNLRNCQSVRSNTYLAQLWLHWWLLSWTSFDNLIWACTVQTTAVSDCQLVTSMMPVKPSVFVRPILLWCRPICLLLHCAFIKKYCGFTLTNSPVDEKQKTVFLADNTSWSDFLLCFDHSVHLEHKQW